ncbi:hypothetical protein ACLESD_52625, partial [Pyxidicoccus sp. 3LFB2]
MSAQQHDGRSQGYTHPYLLPQRAQQPAPLGSRQLQLSVLVGHFAAPSAQPEERRIYPLTGLPSSGL